MFKPALALIALSLTAGANATVLFADNFDGQATGLTVTSLPGWTVSGNVDVVDSGTYGITCDVKCVDLDGTTGPGGITSDWVNFTAGQKVTVSYDVSGSQRSSAADYFSFTIGFSNAIPVLDLTLLTGFPNSPFVLGNYPNMTDLSYGYNVPGNQGFTTFSLSFTPVQSGQLYLNFLTTSGDNIGPVLDNVLVSQVPEPATWAMLIAGFGMVGTTMRRRRAVAA